MASEKKFAWVRWLEEDSVGVMPTSAASLKKGLYVGCHTKMKWKKCKQLYDVEILKLSNNLRDLNVILKKLLAFEISYEDLLTESENCVSSTTPEKDESTPVRPGRQKRPLKQRVAAVIDADADILEATKRAKLLFNEDSEPVVDNSVITQSVTKAVNNVSNSRFECINKSIVNVHDSGSAILMEPSHKSSRTTNTDCTDPSIHYDTLLNNGSSDSPDNSINCGSSNSTPRSSLNCGSPGTPNTLLNCGTSGTPGNSLNCGTSGNSLYCGTSGTPGNSLNCGASGTPGNSLNYMYGTSGTPGNSLNYGTSGTPGNSLIYGTSGTPGSFVSHGISSVSSSNSLFLPADKGFSFHSFEDEMLPTNYHQHPYANTSYGYPYQNYCGGPGPNQTSKSSSNSGETTTVQKVDNFSSRKVPSMKVELVEGYNVFLTKRELNDAIDMARDSPTRLIRNLMGTFFSKEVLAKSSALGGRLHPGLDKDIVSACIKFVQSKYSPVTRTSLVDAINDRCANARRKGKKDI